LNLRSLRYLVAVADTGHFGRAAERCHVSQPTLSVQIRRLEAYLGCTLLERRHKHVQPTAAGLQVVALARVMLSVSEQIRELGRNARDDAAAPPPPLP
jgi:LysR family hydrogen peroxide-inducible transcriptional activator